MTKNNIIFGLHTVEGVLRHHPERVLHLEILDGRQDERIKQLIKFAHKNKLSIQFVSRSRLDQLSDGGNHQGILAFCAKQHQYTEADLEALLEQSDKPAFLLILDEVQDPHNLGACMRSADAAGVQAIIAPKHHSVGITPVVHRVASGAADTLPFVQVTNLARTMEHLKTMGIWIYGAAAEAQQLIYDVNLTTPIALVLGAEGKGMRRLTREHCDALIKIPMQGTVSSLNVSVATGICLFEAVRQRTI